MPDSHLTQKAHEASTQVYLGQNQGQSNQGTGFDIAGDVNPRALITLKQGVPLLAQPGLANWFDDGISWSLSGARNGLRGFFNRLLGGEPDLFLAEFAAKEDGNRLSITGAKQGSIVPVELKDGQSLVVNRGAFIAAEKGAEVTFEFQGNRPLFGLFGGEGMWMQKITAPENGSSLVLLNPGGTVEKLTLEAGQHLHVDNRNLAARDPSVEVSLERVHGVGKMLLGGLGFTTIDVQGPGDVYLQHDKHQARKPVVYAGGGSSFGHDHDHHMISQVAQIGMGMSMNM